MPHFRHHFTPSARRPLLFRNLSVLIRDYLPKGAIFGDRWTTRDFPKISENRGQSTTDWRFPILPSNRGWEFPIFGIILDLPRGPDLAGNLASSYSRLATERGHFRRQVDYP